MKCTPQDQNVHIYIKSVKEMVVYSLASDPINDFFHKGYFASSSDALLKSVRDGTQDLADDMGIWRAYRVIEEKLGSATVEVMQLLEIVLLAR